jgi:sugar phosphate isomerase/epimerase
MKLAFTTLACPDWTLEQAVDAAARYDYAGLELRLLDGELLTPDLDTAARRRVRDACEQAGLALICVDTSVRVAQPDPQARGAQVRDGLAFLELAAEWGAPLIRVFGGPPPSADPQAAIDGAAACLEPLAERARDLGVAVALETHDAFARGSTVAQVLDKLGGGAGALWDTLHPYRMGEATAETVRLLRDRILHVHIKDGRQPAGGGTDWDLTLLGEGQVPVPEILGELRRGGYDGWLAVEWEKKWHPHLADPDTALRQHADVLRGYLAALE